MSWTPIEPAPPRSHTACLIGRRSGASRAEVHGPALRSARRRGRLRCATRPGHLNDPAAPLGVTGEQSNQCTLGPRRRCRAAGPARPMPAGKDARSSKFRSGHSSATIRYAKVFRRAGSVGPAYLAAQAHGRHMLTPAPRRPFSGLSFVGVSPDALPPADARCGRDGPLPPRRDARSLHPAAWWLRVCWPELCLYALPPADCPRRPLSPRSQRGVAGGGCWGAREHCSVH